MIVYQPRNSLSSYLSGLLSAGQAVFSRDSALKALRVKQGAFLDAAEKLQKRGRLISPRQGFYVVIPPQYLSWGAPPPNWYIDDLMRHEGHPYYVGLLKAAELHGATHQAVMEFQVITDKRLPRISAGRSALSFYYRKDMAACAVGIEDYKTDTGRMKISSVELTIFDLLRYPQAAGGLDNIATVIADLGEKIDAGKLVSLAPVFERNIVQRAGYLIDRMGYKEKTEKLHEYLSGLSPLPWLELTPQSKGDPDLTPEPVERNDRWHVIIRKHPEVDE
jgi:predicted transcriptional regulator of viral defense system